MEENKMFHVRSYYSDEYLYIYDLTADVGYLNAKEREILEKAIQTELRGGDVVESSVDFEGDKLLVYATATEDIWIDVLYYLREWDVDGAWKEREYEVDDFEDCEPSWYNA